MPPCDACAARHRGARNCCRAGHHAATYSRRPRAYRCVPHQMPPCVRCRINKRGTAYCCGKWHHKPRGPKSRGRPRMPSPVAKRRKPAPPCGGARASHIPGASQSTSSGRTTDASASSSAGVPHLLAPSVGPSCTYQAAASSAKQQQAATSSSKHQAATAASSSAAASSNKRQAAAATSSNKQQAAAAASGSNKRRQAAAGRPFAPSVPFHAPPPPTPSSVRNLAALARSSNSDKQRQAASSNKRLRAGTGLPGCPPTATLAQAQRPSQKQARVPASSVSRAGSTASPSEGCSPKRRRVTAGPHRRLAQSPSSPTAPLAPASGHGRTSTSAT